MIKASNILFFFLTCFFMHVDTLASDTLKDTYQEPSVSKISKTFSNLEDITPTIGQIDYLNFLRVSIIAQPEYLYAISTVTEKDMSLKFAKRNRFPDLSFNIINDTSLKRKITDNTAIRKRRDDSFDAAVSLSQPIYSGGSINSKIAIAKTEYTLSNLQKEQALSEQILEANRIYILAVISDVLYNYGLTLLNETKPYLQKVKDRVEIGIADPIELALFSIKLHELESKIQKLRADRNKNIGSYEYFFKVKYSKNSLPSIFVPLVEQDRNVSSYDVEASILNHKSYQQQTKLVKSEFRPQFGFNTKYTRYDIKDDNKDTDIRGGLYFSMPIFTFGRATAKISSAQAKAKAAQMYIDIERKKDDVKENDSITIIDSSQATRVDVYNSFIDTRAQRRIIKDRLDIINFAAEAYVDSGLKELMQLERLLQNELNILHGYLVYLDHNKSLTSFLRVKP